MNSSPKTPAPAEPNVPKPIGLDPFEDRGPFRVSWEIDSDDAISPAQAALHAW